MNRRAFTLVELAAVLAISAIIAALSLSAFGRLKDRTRLNTFHANLVADMQNARNRAMLDGRPVIAVLLNSSSGTTPDRFIVFEDKDANFNLTSFSTTIAAPDELLDDQTVAGTVGFGPGGGWGTTFPAPFDAVPSNSPCTFVATGFTAPYDRRAAVSFNPDGSLGLSNGAQAGSITLYDSKAPSRVNAVALIAPAASVKGFSK